MTKTCFVIAPIGDEGSDIRKRSDLVFKYVIEPVTKEHGYRAEMAHHMAKPGTITTQIVQEILTVDLLIADLTGHNANVLYELAIRHMVKRPVVQLIRKGEKIPFDISQLRTIQLDHTDLESVDAAKAELSRQIAAVEKDPSLVDSPISIAVDLGSLKGSTKPVETALAEIMSRLGEIKAEQHLIKKAVLPSLPSADKFASAKAALADQLTKNYFAQLLSTRGTLNSLADLRDKTDDDDENKSSMPG